MQSVAIPSVRRAVAASVMLLPFVSLPAHQGRSYNSPRCATYTAGAPNPPSPGPQPAAAIASRHVASGKTLDEDSSSRGRRVKDSSVPRDLDDSAEADLRNPPQMPSRENYANYEEYLNVYDQYLQETTQFFTSARVSLQRQLCYLHAAHASLDESVRWEYLWTFVPFIFTLCIHMVDMQHHTNARITRERLKQRTKTHVKDVKWVSV
ncbi:hypothetical protein JKF63_00480 [Porcisia hertigi]|uniref:Uncharacterized protein n=1 Tax=Porcisia hertigi TaxID=2761500 RepID=A0A836I8C2_9TRYP|nr:hypothetical protein JKF63_00480 [Porcisia hertigi]